MVSVANKNSRKDGNMSSRIMIKKMKRKASRLRDLVCAEEGKPKKNEEQGIC